MSRKGHCLGRLIVGCLERCERGDQAVHDHLGDLLRSVDVFQTVLPERKQADIRGKTAFDEVMGCAREKDLASWPAAQMRAARCTARRTKP
jgi:hypothetical protein